MFLSREEATKRFAGVTFRGGVWVGERADIGADAVIAVVHSRYSGNIFSLEGKVMIRIGCEVHCPDQWDTHGDRLAASCGEFANGGNEQAKQCWFSLKSEAANYEKDFPQCVKS